MRFLPLLFSVAIGAAHAQEAMHSSRPMGFFGDGHKENHAHYDGLMNAVGGSCCNGKDCRPTQAHWDDAAGTWDFMVDGKWHSLTMGDVYKVLTPEVFMSQGRERWDAQAHVCTNLDGTVLYCFIPPASGG